MKHPRSRLGRSFRSVLSSVAAISTLLGCSSTSAPATGDPALDLKHQDARVRILATRDAVARNRMDLVPGLVENLSDRDEAVRMFTSIGLRKLTGKDFGYNPSGAPEERFASIERWKEWLHSAGFQGTMDSTASPQGSGERDSPPPGTALKDASAKESAPGTSAETGAEKRAQKRDG